MFLPIAKPFFELSANKRHEREDNNPFESAKQCSKHYASKCKSQTGVHAIADHVAVVSYWEMLAVDGRGAFAIYLRCLKSRVAVRSFHVEFRAKGFQITAKMPKLAYAKKFFFRACAQITLRNHPVED